MNQLTPPLGLCTDSYKAGHHLMYPPGTDGMNVYAECRRPLDSLDQRLVFFGSHYYLGRYLRPWTENDVEEAEFFFSTHGPGGTPYPFPADLLRRVVRERGGRFPVKVQTLTEGDVFYPHIPFLQIRSSGEFAVLGTFLETLLSHLWYPITVATISRHARTIIQKHFAISVDPEDEWLLSSRLHDFGFRGCTVLEQAMIGGAAHLLSFDGTDTCPAGWYARGRDVPGSTISSSIPATEHSVMMAWPSEVEVCNYLIDRFGNTIYANVADTYNFYRFLENVLPVLAPRLTEQGGTMVIRPDSGDPIEGTLAALRAAEKNFGARINRKGYKVLAHSAVIYGDSMTLPLIGDVLIVAENHGYSAQNIAFGMGAGLLQKCNRDTLSVATKLSSIWIDGVEHEKMKCPVEGGKESLPGRLQVNMLRGRPTTFSEGDVSLDPGRSSENLLRTVYTPDGWVNLEGPTPFSEVRERLNRLWSAAPPIHTGPISPRLLSKINNFKYKIRSSIA